MKRRLLSLLVCLILLFSAVSTGSAVPLSQEGASGSDAPDVFEVIGVFSEFVAAGIEAAGTQLYSLDPSEISGPEPAPEPEPEPEVPDVPAPAPEPEVPEPAPEPQPEPDIPDVPAPAPEPAVPEPGPEPEPVPEKTIPEDPEKAAVSTGIEVDTFYNRFKKNLKALGVHSISFEERAGKNTSRIDVDGNITIHLLYEKTRSGSLIERITYKALFENVKQLNNAETVLYTVIYTLCDELDLDFEEAAEGDIINTALDGGAGWVDSLLYYGSAKNEDGKTGLTVRIYYTGG